RDEIFDRAAELTFRVLLAFFPFLVFLMALIGFLELESEPIFFALYFVLPDEISELVENFVYEISKTRNTGILSAALFFSVYNTTNGFRAVIRGTNRAYGIEQRRGFFSQVALSFLLMIIFSGALILMLALLFFGGAAQIFFALVILFFFTSFIYKLACEKKLPAKHIFPGAIFTVCAWLLISFLFGIFTRNFSRLPMIYGSIAGVFLLVLWLNAVGITLLIGNEINAMLREFTKKI
ncbi:MAG: YihY/virulence factor BrkB family protein, partial [Defluviitaleaceae bacterium]|nr:YihY/virulence factor BrkB family protein [Defluviitaleaceae bacterium]